MSALTSIFSHPDIYSPSSSRAGLSKRITSISQVVKTRLFDKLAKVRSETPEQFYQNHVNAIYMAIYLEVAMGPLLGAVALYLYSH